MGIYLDSDATIGKLIVLDEAHKVSLAPSSLSPTIITNCCSTLTAYQCPKLLQDPFLHYQTATPYEARVLISTQEPTISPRLIDLCTMTVIHRFISPDWMNVLKKHVFILEDDKESSGRSSVFNQILRLKIREAFVYAPSAVTGTSTNNEDESAGENQDWKSTADELIKVRIRKRVTWDGGASVLCV